MIRTTVFSCVNLKYSDYIPMFVYSMLHHNNDVVVEIGVDELIESESIQYLKHAFKERFIIYPIEFKRITVNGKSFKTCPHIIRFINEPKTKNDYVFISDIDMITLEQNITDINVKKMGLNNCNNIVRPQGNRITGLHFSKWNAYYPLDLNFVDDELMSHDENFLYEWVINKKGNAVSGYIPQHGIHICSNHKLVTSLRWQREWKQFRGTLGFKFLENLSSERIFSFITQIDNFMGL